MAEEIDFRFLGGIYQTPQGDVRQVKPEMAQIRTDNVNVDSNVVALSAAPGRMEGQLEAFRNRSMIGSIGRSNC